MRKTEYASEGSKTRGSASDSVRSLPSDELGALAAYRDDPAGFARDILGSEWWAAQEEIAGLLATNRRVAVKAANGVGKTFLAADLLIWFLYTHSPSVVLTTAPTWRQVESLLWEEVRRRVHTVNVRAELDATRPKLPGSLLQTKLKVGEGHFAMGLSTDEPVRFQGFHADDLLVILDEACGVPEEIWDAVEGICVGSNNRVLAISNPLAPTGRFYGLFKSPRWKTYTISALAHPNVTHPNVTHPDGRRIPGAVTREAVEDRIAAWCEPVSADEVSENAGETLAWEGRKYRPDGLFLSRVLGEFPDSATDSLFELKWIESAMQREAVSEDGPCVIAADIARFGSDETVLAVRRGDRVTHFKTYRGLDTMRVAERIQTLAREERAEIVTVDEVGIGAGVVDRLSEEGLAGLVPVQFGARPLRTRNAHQFLNLRAQTYWALRERMRDGNLALPHDAVLSAQLSNLRYHYTQTGQIQIESKDDMRRRGLCSPDKADALALLFGPSAEFYAARLPQSDAIVPGDRTMQAVPIRWNAVSEW